MAESIDWRKRALSHAHALEVLLCVRADERGPNSQVAMWYEEARETRRLDVEDRRAHVPGAGPVISQLVGAGQIEDEDVYVEPTEAGLEVASS